MRKAIWTGVAVCWLMALGAVLVVGFGLDVGKLLAQARGSSKGVTSSIGFSFAHLLAHPVAPLATIVLAITLTGFAIWLFRYTAKEQAENEAIAANSAVTYLVTIASDAEVDRQQMQMWFYGIRAALRVDWWSRWCGKAPHIIWSYISKDNQIGIYLSVVGGDEGVRGAVAKALTALGGSLQVRLVKSPKQWQGKVQYMELRLARASHLPIRTDFSPDYDPLDVLMKHLTSGGSSISLAGVDILMRPANGGWAGGGRRQVARTRQHEAQKEGAVRSTVVREQNKDIEDKLANDKYGMDVIVRVYAAGNPADITARISAIARDHFAQYSGRNHFTALPVRYGPPPLTWNLSWEDVSVLDPSECAAVAHLPRPKLHAALLASSSAMLPPAPELVTQRVPADEVSKWQPPLSRPLPPAEQIKRSLPLGSFDFGDGSAGIVGLNTLMSFRQMHIIGPMGVGKSTLIGRLAKAAFDSGDGGMVVEPAFDLTRAIMERIAPRDWRRVFYIDPGELYARGRAFTLNIMECPNISKVPDIQSLVMLVLKAMVGAKTWDSAPRMQTMMEASVQTLLEAAMHDNTQSTINEFYQFLNSAAERGRLIPNIRNENLRNFWLRFFAEQKPEKQQEAFAPVVTRIVKPLLNDYASSIVSSRRSTLDMRRAMDTGQILLVNLPGAGNIDEGGNPVMSFIGMLLVMKMRIAANLRGDIAEHLRRPFYAFLDEGHNFITPDVPKMFTELRKFRVSVAISHQTLAQLEKSVLDVLINAVGNRINFRADASDAKYLAEYSLNRQVSVYDLSRLPNTYAYARLMSEGSPMPVCTIRTFPWAEPPVWKYPPANFADGYAHAQQRYPAPSRRVQELIQLVECSLVSREDSYQHANDHALMQLQQADYDTALTALRRASAADFAAVQELQQRRDEAMAEWLYRHPGACENQLELIKWLSMLQNTIPLVLVTAEARRAHSPDVEPAQLLEMLV